MSKIPIRMLLLLGALFFFPLPRHAQEPLLVPMLQAEMKIDGHIEESVWSRALSLELAYETQPGENIPAPVRTQVMIFHDHQNIYFAVRAEDPKPSAIRSRLAAHDQIGSDDLININLDTFNDQRRNYFFGCNPYGIQRDGIETTGGDTSWDAIWSSVGHITAGGYEIEIAIPFSSIRFQRTGSEQVWGLDISRWYQKEYLHRLGLVPIDRNNNSYQSQFLKIKGFAGIVPSRNIEIVPTLTAARSESRQVDPPSPWQTDDKMVEPGLSAGWGLTPNLTLSGTVNPDFSQVEADARQMSINEPFAIFFQEKRPFFTEGSDFFSSPMNILYTRTMRNPDWGVKMSGKEGGHTIGAYLVQDSLTNLLFPGSQGSRQTSLDQGNMSMVLRYKKDFGPRYTLGGILSNRQGEEYHNRVMGFDGALRFSDRHLVSFQLLGSDTAYPEELAVQYAQNREAFTDMALFTQYRYQSRSVHANLTYQRIGPDFRADLGFIPKVGYDRIRGNVELNWFAKPGAWWSNVEVAYGYWRENEIGNSFLQDEHSLGVFIQGIAQSYLFAELETGNRRYQNQEYLLTSGFMEFSFQPGANTRLSMNLGLGDQIDYAHNRCGKEFGWGLELEQYLGKHLQIDAQHMYERLNVGGQELYTANITQGALIYHLNRRAMVRAILQYVHTGFNTDNFLFPIAPIQKELFSQFLFSYRLSPRSLFFLGYSDNGNGDGLNPLRRADWSVFMKLSYSWRL